jgi:hypothetical protein
LVTVTAYLALFGVGAMQGLIGCFEYAHSVGTTPVVAWGLALLVLVTCFLAGAGMGTPLGGLVLAIGWFAASFLLSLPTSGGSVIVTNTASGKWFLYGGAVCAGIGIALSFRFRRPLGGARGWRA